MSLAEISGEQFVGLKRNCRLKATIMSLFQHAGFVFDSAYVAEDLLTVAEFIKSNLGVSVLPKTMGLELDGLLWVPIKDEGWYWEVGLKWRENHHISPAAKQFIAFIQNKYK
ncbi:LysR substrate-binding domain-containing protein [Shouchella miscanthi]|uniref:LysR substrate-binding domain-containing protein n=1 Tax=Shouchella miscanthi TaxID=2598861 RepID=A0ABU6NHZ2_9BACI|nr:LysR substrate-binding domain-containing protein [Shouchella miscanthi]